jgi:hypothetical protein
MKMEQRDFRMPATGEAWRHYKGGLYTVVGMGQDADGQAVVVYTEFRWSLVQGPPLYVRFLGDFVRQIEIKGGSVLDKSIMRPRFTFDRDPGCDERCPFIRDRPPVIA